MLRKEFFANYSEVFEKSFHRVAEADSEEKSTFCFAVTHQQLSRNSYNTCIRLHLVEFTQVERAVQP